MPDHETAHDLTGDELDQVSGGFSFLGGFGTAGYGASLGPISGGAGIAHGGPNGDLYGTVYGGGSPVGSGFGTAGGLQANVAFGFGNHSFDDVVTGHSTTVEFGFGTLSYNENGFTVGLGPSGVGVSHSQTTNLTQSSIPPEVQENLNALNGPDHSADLNQPPPQLNDWSGSFGDHEGAGSHGTPDTSGDHGTHDTATDHGTQDTATDHGTQDTAPVVDHSNDPSTDSGIVTDHGDSNVGNDFGDPNSGGGNFGGSDFSGTQFAGGDFGGGGYGGDFGGGDFGGGDFGGFA